MNFNWIFLRNNEVGEVGVKIHGVARKLTKTICEDFLRRKNWLWLTFPRVLPFDDDHELFKSV